MHKLRRLIVAATLVVGGAIPMGAPASATEPLDAVDASLSISGQVSTLDGSGGLEGVAVYVFPSVFATEAMTSVLTGTDGSYTVTDLGAYDSGYILCFDGRAAMGGGISSGFMSSCFGGQAWAPYPSLLAVGVAPPAPQTNPVPIPVGQNVSGIDAALAPAGAISGTVTDAASGTPQADFQIVVSNHPGVMTAADGTFTVTGLDPALSPYTVCFGDQFTTLGYASECYDNQPFSNPVFGNSNPVVAVTAGVTTTGIDAALEWPGSISGTVTAVDGSGPIYNAAASVYDGQGNSVATAITNANGVYVVTGLAPSTNGYQVCFTTSPYGHTSRSGYLNECYPDAPISGSNQPSGGTTLIPVTSDSITRGIDAALAPAAGISGTVTSADGAPLFGAVVRVSGPNGSWVAQTLTAADGTYVAPTIPPSDTGYVVCFDLSEPGNGTTGFLGECFQDIPSVSLNTPPPNATLVPVEPGLVASGIDATLERASGISGTVTLAGTGAPIFDALVVAWDNAAQVGRSTNTREDGSYTLALPPSAGGYTICVNSARPSSDGSATGSQGACYRDVPWEYPNPPPAGATAVPVQAQTDTTGIDIAVIPAAGISGTVTSSVDGSALEGVSVTAFDSNDQWVESTQTAADGTYTIPSLNPSAEGYRICFDTYFFYPNASQGGGFLSSCYHQQPWNYTQPPAPESTPVVVDPGTHVDGIDEALQPAAGISGKVTDGGVGLNEVRVAAYSPAGDYVGTGYTREDGSYTIPQVAAGDSVVCFDGSGASGPSQVYYLSECYDDQPWQPDAPLPTGPTIVTVLDHLVTPGVDAELTHAAGITGTVTDGELPVAGVAVTAYDATDIPYASAITDNKGAYTLPLEPSAAGYRVCFDATSATGGPSPAGYFSECYQDQPWEPFTPPASGSTPVAVEDNEITTDIDAELVPAGGISGVVHTDSDELTLEGVTVTAFDPSGRLVSTATSTADGEYTLPLLTTAARSYLVCFDASDVAGGYYSPGYASRCYADVEWRPGDPPAVGAALVPTAPGAVTPDVDVILPAL